MEEKTLLSWKVKHRGTLTSTRNFLVLLIPLIFILFYVFTSQSSSQQKDSQHEAEKSHQPFF